MVCGIIQILPEIHAKSRKWKFFLYISTKQTGQCSLLAAVNVDPSMFLRYVIPIKKDRVHICETHSRCICVRFFTSRLEKKTVFKIYLFYTRTITTIPRSCATKHIILFDCDVSHPHPKYDVSESNKISKTIHKNTKNSH